MKRAALLFLAILCCSLFFPGCGSSTTAETTTTPVSIQIGSPSGSTWDSKQGLAFYLVAKDLQGKLVAVSGTLEAKLYLSEFVKPNIKGPQVQQWSDVKVSAGDFDATQGTLIRLEYRNYTPAVVQPGTLEITLLTKDGKKFSATATSVALRQ